MSSKKTKKISAADWERLVDIYEEARALTSDQREAFLVKATAADPDLRAEIDSLLASEDRAEGFLRTPVRAQLPALEAVDNETNSPRLEAVPLQIGKYQLLYRLSAGGMGEVYLGKVSGAAQFEKQLAIKRVLSNAGDRASELFKREAQLSSHLNHPNIVHIYDFLEDHDCYYLVMEYISGVNLSDLDRKLATLGKKLPLSLALYIIEQACMGLDYAHHYKDETGENLNIIHRDISPQNVMLSYEGTVKIVDFGIAKAKGRASLTRTGAIVGKLGYMSPEQLAGEELDPRTDIYSLGVVLLELATRQKWIDTTSEVSAFRQLDEPPLPRLRKQLAGVHPEVQRIIGRAMEREREKRYPGADHFQQELRLFLNQEFPYFQPRQLSSFLQESFAEERKEQQVRSKLIRSQSSRKYLSVAGVPNALSGKKSRPWLIYLSLLVALASLGLVVYLVVPRVFFSVNLVSVPITLEPRPPAPPAPVKPATGTLNLVLDQPASVIVDGEFVADVTAHQVVRLTLRAETKHQLLFGKKGSKKMISREVLIHAGGQESLSIEFR